jgi:RHS repeat-associated protein
LSWTYDSFGNRKGQTVTVSGSPNTPVPQTETAKYDTNNNHVTFATTAMAGFVYDNSGNVTNDGINTYVYDAEGRLCAMLNGTTKLKTGYAYDGLGNRIAKGAISSSSLTCDSSVFTPTTNFVVGLNGEQLDELDGQGKAQHYNVYANGQLLATYVYAQSEWVYAFNDWLGTKRVTTDAARSATGTCLSLPFGDALNCSGGIDPSEHHFTGKERDSETGFASGNDYFGARYYGSSMGRFMSPDPSQLFYADPTNPQSLNLYSYGRNNPLTNIDPTGLDCVHVNNDTGAYEGFESGDCDNSTAEKANSGYYVDGTINQISFNNQNQVIGYSGSTGDGTFNSFAGSTSMDVGSSAFGVNPYTGSLSTGQSVIVNANGSPTPNPTSINVSNLVDRAQLQNFRPGVHYIGPYTPPSPPNVTGDPSCFGAPDAVSAIHSLQRGVNQNPPSGSSDGQFGKSIYQRTTQGDRPFGNAAADTGFNAAFLGLDYAVAVGNCLQGH